MRVRSNSVQIHRTGKNPGHIIRDWPEYMVVIEKARNRKT